MNSIGVSPIGVDPVCYLTNTEQQPFSIEGMIDKLIENPNNADYLMAKLSSQCNSAALFASLINGIVLRSIQNPVLLNDCLDACVQHINDDTLLLRELFEHYPLEFGHLALSLNKGSRLFVVSTAIQLSPAPLWKDFLKSVLTALKKECDQQNQFYPQKIAYFNGVISSLSDKQLKRFIKSCGASFSNDCFAILLAVLNRRMTKFALNQFKKHHPLDKFDSGPQKLIESLSLELPFEGTVRTCMDYFIQAYCREKKARLLTEGFKALNPNSRVNVLACMSYYQRRAVLIPYRNNLTLLTTWLDSLYKLNESYEERKGIFTVFFSCLTKGKQGDFLQLLSENESQMLPFALVCVDKKILQEIILNQRAGVRTEWFSRYKVDSSSRALFEEIIHEKDYEDLIEGDNEGGSGSTKTFLYSVMSIEMSTDLIDVDGSISVEGCHDHLQFMALLTDLEANYISFINKMPSLLLGIACTYPHYRATILKLARHLNEEQLKFLIMTIPDKQAFALINPLLPALRRHQFKIILQTFSLHQLKDFTEKKVLLLLDGYQSYETRLKKLMSKMDEYVKVSKLISAEEYQSNLSEAMSLLALGRIIFSAEVTDMRQFLENLGPFSPLSKACLQLEDLTQKFEGKKRLFEGRSSIIFARLDELKSLIDPEDQEEDYDPYLSIYEGFWSCIPTKVLEPIGIATNSPIGVENLGELRKVGIKTDQDLDGLFINKERQAVVEQLGSKIRNFFPLAFQVQHPRLIQFIQSKLMEGKLAGTVPLDNLIKQVKIKLESRVSQSQESTVERDQLIGEEAKLYLFQEWEKLWDKIFSPATPENELTFHVNQLVESLELTLHDGGKLKIQCVELAKELLKLDNILKLQRKKLEKAFQDLSASQPNDLIGGAKLVILEGLKIVRRRQTVFCLYYYFQQGAALKEAWEFLRTRGYHTIQDLFTHQVVTSKTQLLQLAKVVEDLKK